MNASRFLSRSLTTLGIAALLAIACVPAAPPKPPTAHVKMVVLPFLGYAPFFIAEAEGYFAEQSLDVEVIRMQRQAEALPALSQGNLDVMSGTTGAGFFNAVAHGAALKIVADKGRNAGGCATHALVARRSLVESGELQGVAQLRGKRISFGNGAIDEYFLATVLAGEGMTTADLQQLNVPEAAAAEAFQQGTMDLMATSEPWITRLTQPGGPGVIWKTMQEVFPDAQFSYMVFGPTLVEQHPDVGERFMVAYLKAVKQYNQGKTDRNLDVIATATQLDRDLLSRTCWSTIRDDGEINQQTVADYQTWAVEHGYLEKAVPMGQLWEPRFVEHARKVLGATP